MIILNMSQLLSHTKYQDDAVTVSELICGKLLLDFNHCCSILEFRFLFLPSIVGPIIYEDVSVDKLT